eukprot:966368_1
MTYTINTLSYIFAIAYALLTSHLSGSTIYITSYMGSQTCTDGPTGTCTLICNKDYGMRYRTFNCGNAGTCIIQCNKKQCLRSSTIIASNSHTFQIACSNSGNNCIGYSTIYLPNAGDATLDMGNSKKCLRDIKVYAGTNTQNIQIHLDSTLESRDEAKNIKIYASSARYLYVSLSNNLEWDDGIVECPVNSNYAGPDIAPCIIDGSGDRVKGTDGRFEGMKIYAPQGAPYGVHFIGGNWIVNKNTLYCTDIDALNGFYETGSSYLPIDTSDDCWWTHSPTTDPTSDPTKDPTPDPTTDPTVDPTTDPTVDPTAAPSFSPSRAGTHSCTNRSPNCRTHNTAHKSAKYRTHSTAIRCTHDTAHTSTNDRTHCNTNCTHTCSNHRPNIRPNNGSNN